MSLIRVLVASSVSDVKAEGISVCVAGHADMALVSGRVLALSEIDHALSTVPRHEPCALVLIGAYADTDRLASRCLSERSDLVVLQVTVIEDYVRIAMRAIDMETLLTELRALVDRAGTTVPERVARLQLRAAAAGAVTQADVAPPPRPLLQAGLAWVHAVLREAVDRHARGTGDLPGLTVTPATMAEVLDARLARPESAGASNVEEAGAALDKALEAADAATEPLAAVAGAFALTPLEFRVVILALAPELDPRYQRCFGLLLDDLGRRVGTLGLYASLLGEPARVRGELAHAGHLVQWRAVEGRYGAWPAADEPLRIDPPLAAWLLGDAKALDHDARVRRALQLVPWTGARLFDRDQERAASLVSQLQADSEVNWVLCGGDDAPGWRALLELGAGLRGVPLIRAQAGRLTALDVAEIEESGVRLGRLARVTGRPLVLDVTTLEVSAAEDDALRLLFSAIGGTHCRAAVICSDVPRVVRLLAAARYALSEGPAMHEETRAGAVCSAAKRLAITLDREAAGAIANRYCLQADRLELALRLARLKITAADDHTGRLERFIAACKDVAAEAMSGLGERLDPAVDLADVVLPPGRMQQLEEIVDSVRLAPVVLDEWRFGERLPYGRGVTALFHGPSGTGKTMAAHGLAKRLGMQILRFDLSRMVSKYIGDTEKNIDRVFRDAEQSGAAILIDEADALLGKRSEVKDAHDRYANIEVAYLLQRMEAYEGLAVLTTNLRQNIDAAFLRRLRFVVDFPRPDADARERIWRRCLPAESHELEDGAFRLLARKIDLTGGHIVQIALRAAFAAAAAGSRIGPAHVAYAAREEFAKLGMAPVELELERSLEAA